MIKTRKRLYIAYGSNLNLEQMKQRCPTAKVVGATVLMNYELLFRGSRDNAVATVEQSKGDTVPVVVWELQARDERALDIYEGFPRLYRKETVRVTLNTKQIQTIIYIMNDGYCYGTPSKSYYNTICEGYQSFGFDEATLNLALQKSVRRSQLTTMTLTVKEQILSVRSMGETNMFDINNVMQIANRESFYALVAYLSERNNYREYSRFILTGERQEEDEP